MFEANLIEAVLQGNVEAVNRFCAAVSEAVFRHALLVCGSSTDAADVAQVTALHALRGLPGLQKRESGRAWLFRIARRVCRGMRMRSRRTLGISFDPADPAADRPSPAGSPEHSLLIQEELRRLGPALRALPKSQRCILLLHDYEGLSTRETARVMDLTEENVRTQLSRARRTVRERFREKLRLN
jgi:RNA polymerase sigma-70 factor (ECF subfamily)